MYLKHIFYSLTVFRVVQLLSQSDFGALTVPQTRHDAAQLQYQQFGRLRQVDLKVETLQVAQTTQPLSARPYLTIRNKKRAADVTQSKGLWVQSSSTTSETEHDYLKITPCSCSFSVPHPCPHPRLLISGFASSRHPTLFLFSYFNN